MEEIFKKILVLNDEFESQLMKNALEKRRIPFVIRSYHDAAYDGLFQYQKGWGIVKAPLKFKEEIISVHKDLSSYINNHTDIDK